MVVCFVADKSLSDTVTPDTIERTEAVVSKRHTCMLTKQESYCVLGPDIAAQF